MRSDCWMVFAVSPDSRKINTGHGPALTCTYKPPQKRKRNAGGVERVKPIETTVRFSMSSSSWNDVLSAVRTACTIPQGQAISIEYTIPHRIQMKTPLESQADFDTLKSELRKKNTNTNIYAKLEIAPTEVGT